jgi:hypothetical protein
MLSVYTYPIPKPVDVFDLSETPLEQLADTATAILTHHKTAVIWFGYLEGWMLTPMEEVRLRKVIRAFPCIAVSRVPLSFSNAWKMEIDTIYTASPHGHSDSDDNGGLAHAGREVQHDNPAGVFAPDERVNQDREAGVADSGLKQAGLDQATKQEGGTEANDGIRA